MRQRYIVLGTSAVRAAGARVLAKRMDFEPPTVSLEVAELSDAEALEARDDPAVRSLAPADVPLSLIRPMEGRAAAVNSPLWGLDAVGATTSQYTGAGVRVAVLDTGLQLEHDAFAALRGDNRIIARNFTNDEADDVRDSDGHGTHCAGTVAGGVVNGRRIGIASDVGALIIGKVLGTGGGTNEAILKAIQWAAELRAHIVSMSLGIDFPGLVRRLHEVNDMPVVAATSMALKQYRDTVNLFGKLADLLSAQNVLLIAATGNESDRPHYSIDVSPPAAAEFFLKVGAVAQRAGASFQVANFSNSGPDVVGPGVDIVSARIGGGLSAKSGTSMATPHVAGVAVLWTERLLRQNGTASWQDIKTEVLASAKQLNGKRIDLGRGLVQAPQT